MKNKLLLLAFVLAPVFSWSQQFDSSNSTERKALVLYNKGTDGLYVEARDVNIDVLSEIKSIYAYNSGTKTLYATTYNGNFAIILTKDMAKAILKDKSLNLKIFSPKYPNNESFLLNSINEAMSLKFKKINKELKDSIMTAKKIAREDSIRRALQIEDSLAAIQRAKDDIEYKNNGKWFKVPTGYALRCDLCDYHKTKDTLICPRIANDTIYWLDAEVGHLGLTYILMHKHSIPDFLKYKSAFQRHCQIFKDSLSANRGDFSPDSIKLDNAVSYIKYAAEIKSIAPYGIMQSWGWELNSADGIEPYFSYFNTSEKTIKYIDLYFTMYNDVGDKCYLKYDKSYVGHVRGVGPVEEFCGSSWNWDRATHYTTPDATEMRIVKLVITYMNGSTKVLDRNHIIFE